MVIPPAVVVVVVGMAGMANIRRRDRGGSRMSLEEETHLFFRRRLRRLDPEAAAVVMVAEEGMAEARRMVK